MVISSGPHEENQTLLICDFVYGRRMFIFCVDRLMVDVQSLNFVWLNKW